ncbi:MAG: glycosyltransferase family 2 protein [Planctomycetota bacterium]
MSDVATLPADSSRRAASALPLLSVVVPAYNEGRAIVPVLQNLLGVLERLPIPTEVVVVNDGSKDDTADKVRSVPGVRLIENPVNLGYGHSLIRGYTAAKGELLAMIDADGTYSPEVLIELYDMIAKGADHAIGQRTGKNFQRLWSKRHVYRWLCQYVTGQRVPDANSGLRIFRRELLDTLRGDLCLGFSFTTSLTLSSIMSGYVVTNTPMPYDVRVGRSHVRTRDVLRTMQYLFQLIAVYNPLKLFLPFVILAFLVGIAGTAYGVIQASANGFLLAVIMLGTMFLLIGQAAQAYIHSRVGLFPGSRLHPPEPR